MLIDCQRKFCFRHVPRRVSTYCNLIPVSNNTVGICLKEEFRTFGIVDFVVEIASLGRFRFLYSRFPAFKVGDARTPDFLASDGG